MSRENALKHQILLKKNSVMYIEAEMNVRVRNVMLYMFTPNPGFFSKSLWSEGGVKSTDT